MNPTNIEITNLARKLTETLEFEKHKIKNIILTGSRSTKRNRFDSDIDLIVIVNDPRPIHREALSTYNYQKHKIKVNLHLYTFTSLRNKFESHDTILAHAIVNSKSLYSNEANNKCLQMANALLERELSSLTQKLESLDSEYCVAQLRYQLDDWESVLHNLKSSMHSAAANARIIEFLRLFYLQVESLRLKKYTASSREIELLYFIGSNYFARFIDETYFPSHHWFKRFLSSTPIDKNVITGMRRCAAQVLAEPDFLFNSITDGYYDLTGALYV